MKHSILIVEDDKRMNEIICDYFEMEGFSVYSVGDGIDALSLFDRESIDIVILDIMIPKLDGWSVCRRLRQRSDVLIVILSARAEEDDKLMGYELGADEYVTKPFSPKVLVASVLALLKRNLGKENVHNYIQYHELSIQKDFYTATLCGKSLPLTVKEYQLLLMLMENPRRVFKRDVLITAIWGYDYFGDGRVVDTNIKTLRKKLGDYAHFIQTVIGVGYRFEVKP